MKVVILNSQVPFVWGGAEYLADSLQQKLRAHGHDAEVVKIPFKWHPPEILPRQILACRMIDLRAAEADLVIAMKFPVYYIPHANKKLWLVHQFRQAYDLWGTPFQEFPDTPEGHRIRDMVIQADNVYLRQVKEIYTNSRIVADRLKKYNDICATDILYPPLLHPEMYRREQAENYFFYPSRITASKRQNVAIEAMRHVKSDFNLVLAGNADAESYGTEMKSLIARYRLQQRVKMLSWISDEEKARWMARSFAVLYLPYNEDSYGYVTLEAFHSRKAVITFTDSGGTHELIRDGVNGMIVPPSPESLAQAMERLWSDRRKAMDMGEYAYHSLAEHNICWDFVLRRLLS